MELLSNSRAQQKNDSLGSIMNIVLIGLFICSGMTSLVYQTLWIRVLSLGVGSTSASMSLVLGIFFLGLTLGSFVAGRLAEKIDRPVLAYGWIEGLIGIYGAFLILLLFKFQGVVARLAQELGGIDAHSTTLNLIKFSLVALLLLPPTVGMGATLPLLVKIVVREEGSIGTRVSRLYGINTVGAVLGALLTSFILIPQLGVIWANNAAAVVNLLILVASIWVSRRLEKKGSLFLSSPGASQGPPPGSEVRAAEMGMRVDFEQKAEGSLTQVSEQIGGSLSVSSVTPAITPAALQGYDGESDRPMFRAAAQPAPVMAAVSNPKANPTQAEPVTERALRPSFRALVLIGCGVTGFSSIAAEVVWNKYLGIFFGTNIFGLGVILSLFLIGIATGSLVLSVVIKRSRNLPALYVGLLFASLFAMLSVSHALSWAPQGAGIIGYYLNGNVPLLWIKAVLTGAILLVPTSIFGALLPLGIAILGADVKRAPRVTGMAYSINTAGAIAGSCLAGLVLIPRFGSSVSIAVATAALGLIAVAIGLSGPGRERESGAGNKDLIRPRLAVLSRVAVVAAAALAVVLSVKYGRLDYTNIIKSAYQQHLDKNLSLTEVVKYYTKSYEEFPLIVEGETAIVSLSHDPSDGPLYQRYFRLKTNGLNESGYDKTTHFVLPKYEGFLGFLPYALIRDPRTAFVVGYGGGYTVDYLTDTDLQDVYVAELEKGVLQAADFVYPDGNPLLTRRNLRVEIEDARYALVTGAAGARDIIVSQPSHSWLSGVANLFTREYFEIVKRNLSSKGVFSQWLNLYNINEKAAASILKTFYTVFPYGAVFTNFGDGEMIMLGSVAPTRLNLQKLEVIAKNTGLKGRLKDLVFNDSIDLITSFSIGREDVLRATVDAPLNTDVNAYAEVNQSRLFYAGPDEQTDAQSFLKRNFTGDYSAVLSPEQNTDPEFIFKLLKRLHSLNKVDKFHVLARKYEGLVLDGGKRDLDSLTLAELSQLGESAYLAERYPTAKTYLRRAVDRGAKAEIIDLLMRTHLALYDSTAAVKVAQAHRSTLSLVGECTYLDALVQDDRMSDARALFMRIAPKYQAYTAACGQQYNRVLASFYIAANDFENAKTFLETAYIAEKKDPDLVHQMVMTYLRLGEMKNARTFADYVIGIAEAEAKRMRLLASEFEKLGLKDDAKALQERISGFAKSTEPPPSA